MTFNFCLRYQHNAKLAIVPRLIIPLGAYPPNDGCFGEFSYEGNTTNLIERVKLIES